VLKKLTYTLVQGCPTFSDQGPVCNFQLGPRATTVVSRSEFCADLESRILSLSKLKLLQKTNQHLGWVIKRKMNCAK